ncbi:MAG: ABC transporter permease [Acidobacteriia bacterium]|nr:ABC transporter permease [Terriglobia bacterium]
MLRWLLARLRPESAGDLLEESAQHSRWWLLRQILSAFAPSANPFAFLWNDVRYGVRALALNPGFTATAVAALSLGIGVNTGIFSLLNGLALRSIPVPGSDRVVSVYQIFHGKMDRNVDGNESMFSVSEYEQYRDQNHVMTGVAAYAPMALVTLGGEIPRQVVAQFTSCNYFDILEERPAGPGFRPADCAAAGSGPVAIISDDLWKSQFGADPGIVGKSVLLNRHPFTIAGIAPPGFHGAEAYFASFWIPITMQHTIKPKFDAYGNANTSWLVLIGRLRDGVSIEQARADLAVISARIDQTVPGRKTSLSVDTATFASMPEMRRIVTGAGAVVLAAVGMVLLIACANVANLLLARAAGRQREIAIRLSVGATRWRLIRQLLTESLLLALIGGALGTALAYASFRSILRVLPAQLPAEFPDFALNVAPDLRVLLFSLSITVATGIAFGLLPALAASRADVKLSSGANGFLRQALVGLQIAVCTVLLISAGLLLRGLWAAQNIDPGFEMKNVASVSFDISSQGYDAARSAVFQNRLSERIAAIPGVDATARVDNAPLDDSHHGEPISLPGNPAEYRAEINYISPEFFPMLNIALVRGRNFTQAETDTDANVAIVNEATAQRLWPGEDPIGKIVIEDGKTPYQIVGVARSAQVSHLGRANETYVYFPSGPKRAVRTHWLVHGASAVSLTAIRAAVREIDPALAATVAPLDHNLEWWRTPSRLVALLAGSLGALALALASIGVYGVVSFAVSRCVREIGIRMALGADREAVRHMILARAMRPVGIGAACGILLCAAVSKILSSLLFGVSPRDPLTFSVIPLFLVGVALLAGFIPARRATSIDPASALRHD